MTFLRWLDDHTDLEPELWCWSGDVPPDLPRSVRARPLLALDQWWLARMLDLVGLRRLGSALRSLRLRWWLWLRRRAPVVYCTDPVSARVVGWLSARRPRVVTEFPAGDRTWDELSGADQHLVLERTDRFLVHDDEQQVRLQSLGVGEDRIGRTTSFVSVEPPAVDPQGVRARLGVPIDALLVAGTGSEDWWSSPELFPVLAWRLRRAAPDLPLHFLWITGADEQALWPFHHDVANVGLSDRFHVTTTRRGGTDVLAVDLLLVSSREQTVLTTCLEAVAVGTPVVITDNLTTGEQSEAMTVVPYLDLDALVDASLGLLRDPDERRRLSDRSTTWARLRHDVDTAAPALLAELGVRE